MFLSEKLYNALPYVWIILSITSLLYIGKLAIISSILFFSTGLLVFLLRHKMNLSLMLMTSTYISTFLYSAAHHFV